MIENQKKYIEIKGIFTKTFTATKTSLRNGFLTVLAKASLCQRE